MIPSKNHLLVLHPWGLGDFIMTLPAIAGFRRHYPEYEIILHVANKAAFDLSLAFDLFRFSIHGSHPRNDLFASLHDFYSLRRLSESIAFVPIDVSPSFTRLVRAACGHPVLWKRRDELKKGVHRVEANLEIIRSAFPRTEIGALTLPVDLEAMTRVIEWRNQTFDDPIPYIVVHLGSDPGQGYKRLPLSETMSMLLSLVTPTSNYGVVLVAGPGEVDQRYSLEQLLKCAPSCGSRVALAPELSLRGAAELVRGAQLVLTGDSGVGHLATLVETPVITVAGPTQVERTKPWGRNCVVVDVFRSIKDPQREKLRTAATKDPAKWRSLIDFQRLRSLLIERTTRGH